MYTEVDRMLRLELIEESESAWSSPIVIVNKPGKIRLCLDSRKINSVTEKDAFPLSQIGSILSRLPRAEFITSLDLKDAFWQIPLDINSRPITAFTVLFAFWALQCTANNVTLNGQCNLSPITK